MNTTDVTIRWRALGWVPPSEQAEYRLKWENSKNPPQNEPEVLEINWDFMKGLDKLTCIARPSGKTPR
jgi:hypothetical protein